jgi:hydroxymethylglutaryl-CoA lyase
MASTSEILDNVLRRVPEAPHPIAYNYLVPNLRGLESLLKVLEAAPSGPFTSSSYPTPPPSPSPITSSQNPNGMPTSKPTANTTEISLFAAATEKFSRTNTNCTIAESLDRCRPITALAKSKGIRVRGYVSVALGCPYEGPDVDPHKVAEMTATLLEMGCDEVSVADTTGMGTAPRTRKLLNTLSEAGIANNDIALHFHDTYGQALVNTVVGLEHGIRTFDSSVGGLGGCPYSKGATGNVATEDLIHLLHSLGLSTGVNLEKMAEIGGWITAELGKGNDSRAGKAMLAKRA